MTVSAKRLEQIKRLAKLRIRRGNLIVESAEARNHVNRCSHASFHGFRVNSDLEAAHVEVLKLEDELTAIEQEIKQIEKDGNFDRERYVGTPKLG